MASAGAGGTAADEVFRDAEGGGGEGTESGAGGGLPGAGSQGEGGSNDVAGPDLGPEDTRNIKGCDDVDIVARGLCEAATVERDKDLREKLWQEYSDYKKIVAGR